MKKLFRNIFLLEFFFGSKEAKIDPNTTDGPIVREKLTPEEEKQKAADELKEWLDNPENRQRIVETAKAFDLVMKGQWFDLKDVMNRTNYRQIQSALNILNTMKLAQCLVAEERGSREVFKITITGKNRIKLLESMEKKKTRELEEIKKELLVLKNNNN